MLTGEPPQTRNGLGRTMKNSAKVLASATVRALPAGFTKSMLRAAALAPPGAKTALFERICSRVAALAVTDSRELIQTNLGLSSRLRCRVPFSKMSYAFGRPENGLSERATLALVTELSRDCDVFIDVGANDGLFTFVVWQETFRKGIRLHWFEPDHDLYERLTKNLAANFVVTRGNCAAVADKKGVAHFYKNLSDDSSGSITDCFAQPHETRHETVETIKLDDYFRENEVNNALVKIDVEGAGYDAWSGAINASDRVNYLVMEMLAPEMDKGLPRKIISEWGFHAYYLRDFVLEESLDGTYRYVPPFWNWLFCRLEPEALAKRLSGT